jgi:hypothetical protein
MMRRGRTGERSVRQVGRFLRGCSVSNSTVHGTADEDVIYLTFARTILPHR